MINAQQQKQAQGWLGKLSKSISGLSHQIRAEEAMRRDVMQRDPHKFARDWHIWGLEMPPTQVKVLEMASALSVGYVGLRSLYYGLSAATDDVYEKGWVAGVLRKVSGYVRSVFGLATAGVALAFLGHALTINPPDTRTTGRI